MLKDARDTIPRDEILDPGGGLLNVETGSRLKLYTHTW